MRTFIVDGRDVSNPEDIAMIQALYSRSAASAEEHLKKVQQNGSGRFMDNYVVKFGHKSIADCGSTTFFIEGVSLLAAKAIQDNPMYSGQETSTRYIDMSTQPIIDPLGTPESKEFLDRWMDFYRSSQTLVADHVRAQFPKNAEEKDSDYEGAVKARTFDILRGFLPAGITTQLSWHTNLRQAGDRLNMLVKHPLEEVRSIGLALQKAFAEKYPASGTTGLAAVSGVGKGDDVEAQRQRELWEIEAAQACTYIPWIDRQWTMASTIDYKSMYKDNESILSTRPRGCVLPHVFSDCGQITFNFDLDFGSFRDLQRHRNGVCRMPMISNQGFHPWYKKQLPSALQEAATNLLYRQADAAGGPVGQYYQPLGRPVQCQVTYGLPAALYVMELRSMKTVHPTLRHVVHWMAKQFREAFPNVALHVDMERDGWTVRRGAQTITPKS